MTTLIIPHGNGYLVHDHSGPTFTFRARVHYVQCVACTLIDTTHVWPLEWDSASRAAYAKQEATS